MTFFARRLLMLAVLTCLSACSTPAASPDETDPTAPFETSALSSEAVNPGEVVFTGPWADEFDRTYRGAQTVVARQVLADGQITEAELAELKVTYVQCLEGLGFTDITVGEGGREEMQMPPEVEGDVEAALALERQCGASSTDWNAIVALQYQIQGNPDHLDTYAIMAQCLVRVGLRPEGYTAADYKADFSSGAFDELLDAKFIACNDDPAHAT
ncbi:MAG: hypothetical protein LBK42_03860 [Propionibacteriaceae bacterium]|jgi:hypothetical protein|nr:hypothetical protein [Propionibacteriaceae bacterium]